MATLNATLTLTSTSTSTAALNLSTAKTLTVDVDLVNTGRISVATGTDTEVLGRAITDNKYVYLKNLDPTNFITVKDDDAAGVNEFMELKPGEFAFFVVKGGIGLNLEADTAACVVEYGFWNE
jgi:hypothetical protein